MDDVVIVGGGHVGLYLAFRLANLGFQVRLFDRKKTVGGSVVCTGIIGIEAFRKFNLPEEVVVGSLHKVRFFSPLNTVLEYVPDRPLARIVDRSRFNHYLEALALSQGVAITLSSHVESIRTKKDSVQIKVLDAEGVPAAWDAKIAIIATGVSDKLIHQVGLQPVNRYLGGAQIQVPHLEASDWTEIHVGREIAPGAFAWVVPLHDGNVRLGLLCEKNPLSCIKRFLDYKRPGWRDDLSLSSIELRPIIQGPIDKSFTDRVLVVGEAAGQIKTTTGGGIYYGLLGADLAVETIQQAFLKNQFKARVLSSYDRNWKKVIAEELNFGYYFRKLFAKFSDEQIEDLFERIKEEDVLNMIHRQAEFDWHKSLIFSIFKIPTVRHLIQEPF